MCSECVSCLQTTVANIREFIDTHIEKKGGENEQKDLIGYRTMDNLNYEDKM